MDMDTLKKKSDLMHDISVEKKNALEKLKSQQILIYNSHIFRADPATIALASALMSSQPEKIYMIDTNDNPCEISDPADFLAKLLEKNQASVNAYHQYHSKFKKRLGS